MTKIEAHHLDLIEATLGRPLTEAELQPTKTPESISAEQREVVKALAATQHVLCVLFVKAITNVSVADATRLIDQITYVGVPSSSPPWGREPGMGNWIFALPPTESVRRYVDLLVERLPPFATVHALEFVTSDMNYSIPGAEIHQAALPQVLDEHASIRLILDLLITETERNDGVVERAGVIELRLARATREVILTLSVEIDIYASVTWQYRDNELLARANAPRLAGFISVLRDLLHARYVSSDGKLETSETGFR